MDDNHNIVKNSAELLKSTLTEIEESNEIVRALKGLDQAKTSELSKQCDKFREEYDQRGQKLLYERTKKIRELKNEYISNISKYFQQELNLSTIESGSEKKENRMEEERHRMELWKEKTYDLPLYYLLNKSVPNLETQNIIMTLYDPLNIATWQEYCFKAVEKNFKYFWEKFQGQPTAIKDILEMSSPLFLSMTRDTIKIIAQLFENLPYKGILDILTNVRDEDGQTRMFYMQYDEEIQLYVKIFQQKLNQNGQEDMYKLLKIKDKRGWTALHNKPHVVSKLLVDTYTPQSRTLFLELSAITDEDNNTVKDVPNLRHHRESFAKLEKRVRNNTYIMSHRPTVLIIYNTKNRDGAEEEAQSIYEACKSKFDSQCITLEKNKSSIDTMGLIKQATEKAESVLIVVLMSHGKSGIIYDCHSQPIKLSEIEERMCASRLQFTPKVLITQCCQSDDGALTPYVPTHDHFCAFMSCIAGDPSERGNFISKLSDQIRKSEQDTNIFRLAVNVTRDMKRERENSVSDTSKEGSKTVIVPTTPIIMSTLKAELCPSDDSWWWRFF